MPAWLTIVLIGGLAGVAAAVLLAIGLFAGAWVGAAFANQMRGPHLRLAFGVFVTALGVYLVHGAFRRLGWL